MMAENEGLHLTPIMDQGDYIKLIVNSVLSNLIEGAALAIIVLALFLKDLRPTIVVAISMPLSVLFAIVLMYFTGITFNILSLSGLALGVGMLVDNSVVVIENIYRLRGRGVPAARASVQGARQVGMSVVALDQASGTSMVLVIGAERPERTITSNTASSAALSDEPAGMIGLISSARSPKVFEAMRISWLFIQFELPLSVLISPLWASMRKGCASHHCGKVLVE